VRRTKRSDSFQWLQATEATRTQMAPSCHVVLRPLRAMGRSLRLGHCASTRCRQGVTSTSPCTSCIFSPATNNSMSLSVDFHHSHHGSRPPHPNERCPSEHSHRAHTRISFAELPCRSIVVDPFVSCSRMRSPPGPPLLLRKAL